ncbi:MAG: hypothetical protein AAF152_07560 [Cyanobacteria bacterium P01_A01_bin.114]
MATSNQNSDNLSAVAREASQDPLAPRRPWEQEGEFEVAALIVSQSRGELLVKVNYEGQESYLTIAGFLPGKVNGQRWRLECARESGQIELLDGEPL